MTIYALSSGPGVAGVAVIRISGEDVQKVIKLLTDNNLPKPRVATIKKFNNNSLVSGFTTNPSLMKQSGAKNYKNYSLKLLKICRKKPISLEVFGDSFKEMLEQGRIINS